MTYARMNSILICLMIVSFVLLAAPKDQWASTFAIMALIMEVRRDMLELRKNDE